MKEPKRIEDPDAAAAPVVARGWTPAKRAKIHPLFEKAIQGGVRRAREAQSDRERGEQDRR